MYNDSVVKVYWVLLDLLELTDLGDITLVVARIPRKPIAGGPSCLGTPDGWVLRTQEVRCLRICRCWMMLMDAFYGIWRIILVLESWAFCESCLVSGGMWKPIVRQVGGWLLAWQKLRLSQIKWWSISLSKLFFFHQVSPKKCKKKHGTKATTVPHLIVFWWTNSYFINKNQPFVTGFLRPPRPEAPKTKEVKETPAAATVASPLAAPIRRKTMMV